MAIVSRRSRLMILSISSALAILALFSLTSHAITKKEDTKSSSHIHVHQHIQIASWACRGTRYPDLCASTVSTFPDLRSLSLPEIISRLVNSTVFEVRDSAANCTRIRKKLRNLDPLDRRALEDCLELLDDTVYQLRAAVADLSSNTSAFRHYMDLQTLFSGAMTNQYTCLDGFAFSKKKYVRRFIEGRLRKISRHVSNSLAMLKRIKKPRRSSKEAEIFPEYGTVKDGFPSWVKKKDRALLQAAANQTTTAFNVTVAKDGSGNFTTINEALQAAPNSSRTRFVIYIKAGAYYEYIEVDRRKTMIMLVGDGIGRTLIKGNRSVVDGWTTFRSSTVGKF